MSSRLLSVLYTDRYYLNITETALPFFVSVTFFAFLFMLIIKSGREIKGKIAFRAHFSSKSKIVVV